MNKRSGRCCRDSANGAGLPRWQLASAGKSQRGKCSMQSILPNNALMESSAALQKDAGQKIISGLMCEQPSPRFMKHMFRLSGKLFAGLHHRGALESDPIHTCHQQHFTRDLYLKCFVSKTALLVPMVTTPCLWIVFTSDNPNFWLRRYETVFPCESWGEYARKAPWAYMDFFDVCEGKGMYSHYIYRLIDF